MRIIKKEIIFGITSLTLGGAERVLVDICNELKNDYNITIFAIYGNNELEKQLSKEIIFKPMYSKSYNEIGKKEKIIISLKLLFMKKRIYKKYIDGKYNIEIAFLEGPITRLFSVKRKHTRKIAWVHNDIKLVFGSGIKAKLKKIMDKNVYKNYEEIVFVTKDNKESFEKTYKLNNKKYVIYNYLDKNKVLEKAKDSIEQFEEELKFVTVSRLVEQKAIDRLIKVHSRLITDGYNHNFYIIGDGPKKKELEQLIKKNNVSKTFKLLGAKENPYPYIKSADYFCLFSYFEGYPMVLEEAKVLNKYILITNTSARENLENYEKSYITENSEEGIYNAIKFAIENKNNVTSDGQYENENILIQIKKLIEGKL